MIQGPSGSFGPFRHSCLAFFEVRLKRDLGRVKLLVGNRVAWVCRDGWEFITVTCGTMPEPIADLPANNASPVPRHDLPSGVACRKPTLDSVITTSPISR
jgi:hypothetical protein